MINRFVSAFHPFFILTDGEEFRFAVLREGTAEEMWDWAVPGELLDEMLDEYHQIKSRRKPGGTK